MEEGSTRFRLGEVVFQKGRNRMARGVSVLVGADAVCMASGGKGTGEMFNLAMGLDKPVLPLPQLDGVSRNMWIAFGSELPVAVHLSEAELHSWGRVKVREMTPEQIVSNAEAVGAALVRAVRHKCLVLMPFAQEFDWVFEEIILPAAQVACVDAVRLDLAHFTGDIAGAFKAELAAAGQAVAVIDGHSPNVLYEIGFAHAVGCPVALLAQGLAPRGSPLALYLRNHRVISYPSVAPADGLAGVVEELAMTLRQRSDAGLATGSAPLD